MEKVTYENGIIVYTKKAEKDIRDLAPIEKVERVTQREMDSDLLQHDITYGIRYDEICGSVDTEFIENLFSIREAIKRDIQEFYKYDADIEKFYAERNFNHYGIRCISHLKDSDRHQIIVGVQDYASWDEELSQDIFDYINEDMEKNIKLEYRIERGV